MIYNQITFPLQLFASQVAEFCLGLIGIPVLRDGNVLELASQKLSVVEACSGIRSLLSLSFLSSSTSGWTAGQLGTRTARYPDGSTAGQLDGENRSTKLATYVTMAEPAKLT